MRQVVVRRVAPPPPPGVRYGAPPQVVRRVVPPPPPGVRYAAPKQEVRRGAPAPPGVRYGAPKQEVRRGAPAPPGVRYGALKQEVRRGAPPPLPGVRYGAPKEEVRRGEPPPKRGAVLSDDAELEKRGFTVGKTLGEGSFGKVKGAFIRKSKLLVAIKIIDKSKVGGGVTEQHLLQERSVHAKLKHTNIIKILSDFEFNNKIFIVLEHAGHGDLHNLISNSGGLSEDKAQELFRQVVAGVGYMHDKNIIHRDLKGDNILLDNMNTIKVSDFGFARPFKSSDLIKTYCGCVAYAPPESLQGIPYPGPAHDIWSLGMILYKMVCNTLPFISSNRKTLIKLQLENKITFPYSKKVSSQFQDLVKKILQPKIKKRCVVAKMGKHPWLKKSKKSKPFRL